MRIGNGLHLSRTYVWSGKSVLGLVGLALLATPVATFAQNCTLVVPKQPLTAKGLATPYILKATDATSSCSVADPNSGVFVQGAFIYFTSPNTAEIKVYNPLVVDAADPTPGVAPIEPVLPADAVVALFIGSNGVNTSLHFTDSHDDFAANCLQGFGQEAWCNAPAFYAAADEAIAAGKVLPALPALGIGQLEQTPLPCPTVRSFRIVDQDQSDNVTTKYLQLPNGLGYASNTAANRKAYPTAIIIANPSDNLLNSEFIDPAIGCTPWMVPDAQDNDALTPSMPTDELFAKHHQAAPLALIPLSDPMTFHAPYTNVNPTTLQTIMDNDVESLFKVDLYRLNTDQPMAHGDAGAEPATYCKHLREIQLTEMIIPDADLLKFDKNGKKVPSPVASLGTDLYAFFVNRYSQSYQFLNCQQLIGLPSNVTVTFNAQGVPNGAIVTAP
jgi:hypothetical protein